MQRADAIIGGMKLPLALAATALCAAPAYAQDNKQTAVTPNDVVKSAPQSEWSIIPDDELMVVTLAPDANGNPREFVVQLLAEPVSASWTRNIRTMARAHWWDGLSIYRSVDNWVVQWGDGEEEESDRKSPAKPLPADIVPTSEDDYDQAWQDGMASVLWGKNGRRPVGMASDEAAAQPGSRYADPYAAAFTYVRGIPVAVELQDHVVTDGTDPMTNTPVRMWPVHCYGSVGVARDLSPDAGTGAELYAVIGHAPRQLDRNIAVVGKVIDGIEHLSILPRGTAGFGVYATTAEHTPIISARLASDLPEGERPRYEFLDTQGDSFARYVDILANRSDSFYAVPAGGTDVCNIKVPVRMVEDAEADS